MSVETNNWSDMKYPSTLFLLKKSYVLRCGGVYWRFLIFFFLFGFYFPSHSRTLLADSILRFICLLNVFLLLLVAIPFRFRDMPHDIQSCSSKEFFTKTKKEVRFVSLFLRFTKKFYLSCVTVPFVNKAWTYLFSLCWKGKNFHFKFRS